MSVASVSHAAITREFTWLAQIVRLQFAGEEQQLFSVLRRTRIDLTRLGVRMAARRVEIAVELGIASPGDTEAAEESEDVTPADRAPSSPPYIAPQGNTLRRPTRVLLLPCACSARSSFLRGAHTARLEARNVASSIRLSVRSIASPRSARFAAAR